MCFRRTCGLPVTSGSYPGSSCAPTCFCVSHCSGEAELHLKVGEVEGDEKQGKETQSPVTPVSQLSLPQWQLDGGPQSQYPLPLKKPLSRSKVR